MQWGGGGGVIQADGITPAHPLQQQSFRAEGVRGYGLIHSDYRFLGVRVGELFVLE